MFISFAPFIFVITLANADDFLEVATSCGKIRGISRKTWMGNTFSAFTGVPYAKPPIGNLRFELPVPVDSWEHVLDATKYRSHCVQDFLIMNITDVTGSEDCLYLNIYTPRVGQESDNLLPVMFYNYGGGWMSGSSTDEFHGPDFLLDEDIVLITHNYRLGPLGFISMVDEVIPGNNGLKDHALALKWVRDNVKYFGGDPNRITVFGNSAGGASSHFLIISPLTRDLISGAILQSGTAFSPWSLSSTERARNRTVTLAQKLGCTSSESKRILNCLKGKDAIDIIRASQTLYEWGMDPTIPFRPVVEVNTKGVFLSDTPAYIIQSGKAAKVPIIITVASEDGLLKAGALFNSSQTITEFSENFETLAPNALLYSDVKDTKKIKSFYLENKETFPNNISQIIKMYTDSWFFHPMYATTQMHSRFLNVSIYQLLYNYRAIKTYTDLFGDAKHNYGVGHCDELLNLFSSTVFGIYHRNVRDIKAVQTITKLWANFARTGNPTPNSELPKWEPSSVEKHDLYYMDNNAETKMGANVYLKRILFWEKIRSRNDNMTYIVS